MRDRLNSGYSALVKDKAVTIYRLFAQNSLADYHIQTVRDAKVESREATRSVTLSSLLNEACSTSTRYRKSAKRR